MMNHDQLSPSHEVREARSSLEHSPRVRQPVHAQHATPSFFLSSFRAIKASRLQKRLSLNQACQQLAEWRENTELPPGHVAPTILGALPFDLTAQAELFIPTDIALTSREVLEADCGAETVEEPTLQSYHSDLSEAQYCSLVSDIKKRMAHSDLRKLVLGRCARLRFSGPVHVASVAKRLIAQNPRDMVFQIPLRDGSILVGASPELLIRKTGNEFCCHPLAGSIPRSSDREEDARRGQALLSSAKDRDEHAIVVAQLRSQLSALCRDLEIPDTPSLTRTATMWHLSTRLSGRIGDRKMSALDLARLIHPTAALCGAPRDLAFRTIAALEPSGRGLFAGLVGWSDARGDGEWAVTIRSGIIKGAEAQLFSGAGIVPGSDPEAEWHEIEAKLGTMRRALGLESVSA
ncbi:hypothetical protein CGLAMM_05915 [Acetobacteraceae bacterium EV16G]|uniref:isochorismate synthase n=1 Tax=Sorlinia euscelidii TaxID=3081148 RepID=A0ABU7U4L9_9PROT